MTLMLVLLKTNSFSMHVIDYMAVCLIYGGDKTAVETDACLRGYSLESVSTMLPKYLIEDSSHLLHPGEK